MIPPPPSSAEPSDEGRRPAGAAVQAEEEKATLSRELGELLLELSIGVHRFGMYPPGHPSLEPVAENVLNRLNEVFRDRTSLTIGVAQRQLVIEGVATDQKHPVLSDLARLLHDEQLGALSFRKGAFVSEVESFLRVLSREGQKRDDDEPLGALPTEELPTWDHITIYPVGYDRLRLDEEGEASEAETDRVSELWLGLAQAAMATEDPVTEDDAPGAQDLAETIESHEREEAYDQVIVGYLLQLAEELGSASGKKAKRIRDRVSTLIRDLDDETLERLVEMGGDLEQRKEFAMDANDSLAADAVVKVLRAAASASEQTISTSLTRLLSKLSAHAEEGAGRVRTQADSALRDHVTELISDWELEDPNPDQYTQVLDSIAQSAPLLRGAGADLEGEDDDGEPLTGPLRIVQMALEVDAVGPTVKSAVTEVMDRGSVGDLLALADDAPAGSRVAEEIRRYVTDPTQLRRVLSGDDVDAGSLRSMVEEMGEAAVEPLLDALVESEARSVRRKVFDALTAEALEDAVAERVVERLKDDRWFVVRNMLALIQRLDRPPEGFDPTEFMRHSDHRVRREAFPLAAGSEGGRERALALALGDDDERMVRMALHQLREGFPETLVPTVVNRVVEGEHAPEIRALAIRTLAGSRSKLARDCLIGVAEGGRTLLGRRKVADPSPPVVAALQVLSDTWDDDEEAEPLLDAARRSKEPQVRAAVENSPPESP